MSKLTDAMLPRFAPRLLPPCMLLLVTASCAVDAQVLIPPDLAVVTARVVDQTNAFRMRNALGPVEVYAQLGRAAQEFAEFMAGHDRIAHDADGRTPAERVKAAGYESCMVAENIAYVVNSLGFSTEELATRFMQGWENSPEHRRNLLLEPVTAVGLGVAQSTQSRRYYAVQLLARPLRVAMKFEIINRASVPVEYEVSGERFVLPAQVTRLHSRCGETTLRLVGADAGREAAVTAKDGVHYVVERTEGGQFRLRSE